MGHKDADRSDTGRENTGETRNQQCSAENIAVVTMLIDHIGAVIVARLLVRNGLYEAMVNQEAYTAWVGQNGGMYGIYMAMRIIGRFAFPIYCFYW